MVQTPDWQSLERKLRVGKPLELAAREAGIDIDAARKWAREQMVHSDTGDIGLLRTANSMLERGFAVLDKLAQEGPRKGSGYENVDLEAAKALITAALNARKILGGSRAVAGKVGGLRVGVQLDLFDKGDWKLDDPSA